MDQRDDQQRGRDHRQPADDSARQPGHEIADADDVEADRTRRAARDDDRLVELRVGQHVVLDDQRVLHHGQGGQSRKGRDRAFQQQHVKQQEAHARAWGSSAPMTGASTRTSIAGTAS